MSYQLIHSDHLGQVYTQYGNLRRTNSTAAEVLEFPTLHEAQRHANEFIALFPELQCEIVWGEGEHETVVNRSAQDAYIQKHFQPSWKGRMFDLRMNFVLVASLLANVVFVMILMQS
ncbi:hypothetical protein [Gimesia maris]|uniref:hypothetical protein n=1 Tax=Gimesia maris TaxID=122 RepID=UPI003A90DD63